LSTFSNQHFTLWVAERDGEKMLTNQDFTLSSQQICILPQAF